MYGYQFLHPATTTRKALMKRTLFSTATIVGLSGLIILSDVGDMPRTVEKIGLIALGTADVLIAAVLLVLGIIHRPPP